MSEQVFKSSDDSQYCDLGQGIKRLYACVLVCKNHSDCLLMWFVALHEVAHML